MNKRIFITGATSGIGRAAAIQFAKEGHEVILGCRDVSLANELAKEIGATVVHVDMSSLASIKQCVEDLRQSYETIDVLIHNAAYFAHGAPYKKSEDHIELTFATNVVGPYALSMGIKSLLEKSKDARVLVAASTIIKHYFNPKKEIAWSTLRNEPSSFRVYDQYCDSKMAAVLLTFALAKKWSDLKIHVNALQINGAKMSAKTLRQFTPKWRAIARIQNLYFPPAEKMGSMYVSLCTEERLKGVTGKLFNDRMEVMEVGEANPTKLEEVRQVISSKRYPRYASIEHYQDNVIMECEMIVKGIEQDEGAAL